jgi:hypothetical protein
MRRNGDNGSRIIEKSTPLTPFLRCSVLNPVPSVPSVYLQTKFAASSTLPLPS